jgi:hypothetical protein
MLEEMRIRADTPCVTLDFLTRDEQPLLQNVHRTLSEVKVGLRVFYPPQNRQLTHSD